MLVGDAELLVVDSGWEIPGGWPAVTDGRVTGVGPAGSEPEARTTLPASGRRVTPGLINTHHHLYQNLTRSHAPALSGSLFDRLTTLYPIRSRLDEKAATFRPASVWPNSSWAAAPRPPTTSASIPAPVSSTRTGDCRRGASPRRGTRSSPTASG
ncbi:hypothetical protein [Streptomyces sp. bgisy027]|uniref:hypothetical protein n=1 Tax=Streptomyces sp. bgisy027 TaxID=3413770 RepID=UPI003D732057